MTYLFSPVYVVTLSKYNQQINSNDCRREEMIEFIICRLISMKFFMEHQEKSKVFCLLPYFDLLVPFAGKMSVGAKGSKTSNPNQNWTHWVNFLVIGLKSYLGLLTDLDSFFTKNCVLLFEFDNCPNRTDVQISLDAKVTSESPCITWSLLESSVCSHPIHL